MLIIGYFFRRRENNCTCNFRLIVEGRNFKWSEFHWECSTSQRSWSDQVVGTLFRSNKLISNKRIKIWKNKAENGVKMQSGAT
jgi:hypothetical protein